MPDLVPVDTQPEFDHSLTPVDYDPFAAETYLHPAVAAQSAFMAGKDVDTLRGILSGVAQTATLPQRAIQNSQFAVDTGNYDPRVPVEAAMLPMGTGAVAGVPVRAGETALGAGMLRVARQKPNGSVAIGKPGDIHADLMTRQELGAATDSPEVASSMGYATPEGKFLTRDEALQFAMQNEPQRAAWSAQQPEFGLDAATYHNEPKGIRAYHGSNFVPVDHDPFAE